MSTYVDFIDQLSQSLDQSFLYSINSNAGVNSIDFLENKNPKETKLKKLTITGFSHVVAINQDKITAYKPSIFKTIKGINKTCDGIVFCVVRGDPYIIVFDMKSSLSNESEHIWKTKCGRNFLSYMNCVLEQFLNVDLSAWKVCYCIFYAGDPKRTTDITPQVSYDPADPCYHNVSNGDVVSVLQVIGKPLIA
jgi:hypothetical protein